METHHHSDSDSMVLLFLFHSTFNPTFRMSSSCNTDEREERGSRRGRATSTSQRVRPSWRTISPFYSTQQTPSRFISKSNLRLWPIIKSSSTWYIVEKAERGRARRVSAVEDRKDQEQERRSSHEDRREWIWMSLNGEENMRVVRRRVGGSKRGESRQSMSEVGDRERALKALVVLRLS